MVPCPTLTITLRIVPCPGATDTANNPWNVPYSDTDILQFPTLLRPTMWQYDFLNVSLPYTGYELFPTAYEYIPSNVALPYTITLQMFPTIDTDYNPALNVSYPTL